ncbi:MAG: hypothetical protein A2600_06595 [Candidatus Lambdaproteobacteria bacterium RIFOXYD1_FULL_56_27]|uniref:Uncharacterized protein n=1 Tax=Candidatus Lambdaproteobacteria bacterium RIFOXYD2_FULL_56_26 TaxID=1817773 RepID=A0A1F6GL03_9PROT|nr:MAG: hypothetical protein A2557_13375 [Candidatus Lambdaproteobacteria bacterium RIFOXYD2_FULL_56_26]OGH04199.1 MAG: hypothetical protein A2426_02285 [Candidatus Lambdaproteobacteria bacterium RIFOXYC1_FULL_56_13]OGH08841.1 MAG: hypothetical protein A2600_06595 [Candidatus Lambdaproteobacteria bacterium RIFOXYD1_FULL_56_27]
MEGQKKECQGSEGLDRCAQTVRAGPDPAGVFGQQGFAYGGDINEVVNQPVKLVFRRLCGIGFAPIMIKAFHFHPMTKVTHPPPPSGGYCILPNPARAYQKSLQAARNLIG